MLQTLYKFIFWLGYGTVLMAAFLTLPWQLDNINVGTIDFHIRLDHLLHLLVYFLICMCFYDGQRNGIMLFRDHALTKFVFLICILATVTEVVQLWIPSRAFNPMDWVANMSGVISGVGVMRFLRKKNKLST